MPRGIIVLMPGTEATLVVGRFRMRLDVSGETFTVNLEAAQRLIEGGI